MRIKKDYNFFSSQEMQKTKNIAQFAVVSVTVAVLISAAILFFSWSRFTLVNQESEIASIKLRISNPEMVRQLQELDLKQNQLNNLEGYTTLAAIMLNKIGDASYASTSHLEALLAILPASIEVNSLEIQGTAWHLECKTNAPTDVALFLHNLEMSDVFQNAMAGSMKTDETGIVTFPVDVLLEGGSGNAAK
jgi:Tfp pilus assembly protein PilN